MSGTDDFRRIALGMDGAIEGAHMGHPDFRVNGRIFATIRPDGRSGMVKLAPDEQQRFIEEHPATFVPENGAWGRQGCTTVRLEAVDHDTLGEAMTLAWQNAVRTPARRRLKPGTKRLKPVVTRPTPVAKQKKPVGKRQTPTRTR